MSNGLENGSEVDGARREALSALMDGELESLEVAQACAHWRADASLRSTWHAYQLAGDVLRSEDLAATAVRDADFLVALRARLAHEPVVLAPQRTVAEPEHAVPVAAVAGPAGGGVSASARRRRPWRWMAPTAVAAGFMAVAGALVVTRAPIGMPSPGNPGTEIAQATPAAAVVPAMSASQVLADTIDVQAVAPSGRYIRDARLDSYLAAHKQFAGSSVLGVPSGFLRNAVAEAGPNR